MALAARRMPCTSVVPPPQCPVKATSAPLSVPLPGASHCGSVAEKGSGPAARPVASIVIDTTTDEGLGQPGVSNASQGPERFVHASARLALSDTGKVVSLHADAGFASPM